MKSDSFASQVYFYLSNTHARFSDNFINILPNQPAKIFCQTDLSIEKFKEQLRFISLK
jgi:beta-mannosidase